MSRRAVALAVLLALLLPAPARAEGFWYTLDGYISIGFAKLFAEDAPGGSLSGEVGFYYPLAKHWSLGPSIGYSLLGGNTVERGSLASNVDYSEFEIMLMAHWIPGEGVPVHLAAGGGYMNASASITASGGGGLAFVDLARSDDVFALGLDATLIQSKPSPVRLGLELGTRVGFLSDSEVWTLGTARLAIHF